MPIYEYHSPDTNKIYQFFSPSVLDSETVPRCPDGEKYEMEKLISGFSITGQHSDQESVLSESDSTSNDDPFADMESSQAKQVMSELEKSMHGLDDENPDPRQMGSMMRKICEMTGEKVDEPMEEILRKLEEGVSPDQIEENMGSVLDENENLPEGNIESEKDTRVEKKNKKIRVLPSRDPVLYDIRDFI